MIKGVIFDLDGVLVDAKELHYKALNDALPKKFRITEAEHLSRYDGLKTRKKLEMLSSEKNLPIELHEKIYIDKQLKTAKALKSLSINKELIELFSYLKENKIKIGVCSNSIRQTVLIVLSKLDLFEYVDSIFSNEDVKNSKPNPEMYWRCMIDLDLTPNQTLIVEDSPYGLEAASLSGANILRVKSCKYVKIKTILDEINLNLKKINTNMKWSDKKLNVIIPMAGAGSRFSTAGYTFPKPLIEVRNKPMIQVVVENLSIDANFIFLVRKEHKKTYNLESMLKLIAPNCQVVEVDGLTEGAACTALLAKNLINNENPLFFANSDQFVEWNPIEFFYKMNEKNLDGGIVTFYSTHPKWSFAKLNSDGHVTEVAEKNPISTNATVGFYYWKHGSDFVKYAEEMIKKNIRVNNEFYVCPVYNQAINDKKKIGIYEVNKMWGLGTPEDLDYFLKNYLNDI